MTKVNQIAGVDWSALNYGIVPPQLSTAQITAALKFWNFFGGTLAKTLQNKALPGASAPSVIGSNPTIAANYMTLGGSGQALNTGIADTGNQTFLCVVRAPNAAFTSGATSIQPMTATGFYTPPGQSSLNIGAGITLASTSGPANATPVVRSNYGTYTTGGTTFFSATGPKVDPTAWRMLAGRWRTGTEIVVFDLTAGTKTAAAQATALLPNPAQAVQLGYSPGGAQLAPFDMAFAAIYNGVDLTDADISTVYAFVKAALAAQASPIAI